jgi:hypothetical protein
MMDYRTVAAFVSSWPGDIGHFALQHSSDRFCSFLGFVFCAARKQQATITDRLSRIYSGDAVTVIGAAIER